MSKVHDKVVSEARIKSKWEEVMAGDEGILLCPLRRTKKKKEENGFRRLKETPKLV